MPDWHGTKGMCVDRMLDPHCDFKGWPHPWRWPLIFKVKFWKCCIWGMGGPINMERKGCESIGCYPTLWLWTVTSSMTLTLEFQGQILKKSWLCIGMPDWHGTKGMWVNRMLDSHCDFELWRHPWPWPWIYKVNFLNSCISGMGGPINMEWKGYEAIGLYTYYATLSYDFDLGSWRSDFKKLYHRNKRVDWQKSMWIHRMLDPSCDFKL